MFDKLPIRVGHHCGKRTRTRNSIPGPSQTSRPDPPDQPAQWKKQVPVGLAIQAESSQHLSECMIKKTGTYTYIDTKFTNNIIFFPL